MKAFFTVFVVILAVLCMVRDSHEFSAAAGTATTGRRNIEKVYSIKRLKSNQGYFSKTLLAS
jgi:hypothetical protein